ncbi:MAG: shikimate kinase [Phycisphaerales bacterium]|nr:shikimate kinase [Phycisphaerales bacterium]
MTATPTSPQRGVILIGMRGVGKTTVGAVLAQQLHARFDDLDDLVLRALGAANVQTVFANFGEASWRAGEAAALRATLNDNSKAGMMRVVAVGAGAPCEPNCHRILQESRQHGWRVIHIDAPIDAIAARLSKDLGGRPMLTALPLADELRELTRQRAHCYASLADAVVDGSSTPERVSLSIAVALST